MTDPTIVRVEDLCDADPIAAAEARELAAIRVSETVPEMYADAVVDVPEVAEWVRAVVLSGVARSRTHRLTLQSGPTLMIMGKVGRGKTHQVYGALRALAASGLRCKWEFLTGSDLYARLRPRHGVDSVAEFRAIANAPLLVIDDLGVNSKDSGFTEEINYQLINHRNPRRLPTLFTTNVLPAELKARFGERVTSRLREFVTDRAVIEGEDRRQSARQRAASERAHLAATLGLQERAA